MAKFIKLRRTDGDFTYVNFEKVQEIFRAEGTTFLIFDSSLADKKLGTLRKVQETPKEIQEIIREEE